MWPPQGSEVPLSADKDDYRTYYQPKPFDSDKDCFRRPLLQTYLHILLMALAVLPIILYLRSR